ncbi:MAG: membrane integrity-associated transporter subunit PqiC [Magnetovibrio sp.]|nr:membrane integrity-associated transporter subunit PqiC [Magnetovibrio sp.]
MKLTIPAFVFVGLVSACATPPPAPEDVFYRLSPRAAAPAAAMALLDGVVEVERFTASGSLASRPLLFSEPGSNAVSEYHYHYWIEAPPILLQNALVSYMRSARVSDLVVTPDMRARPDYTVRGRLIRLETVQGETSVGVAELESSLRRESDGELLVLGEYRAEVVSGSNGIKTDAAAIEKAVNNAFQQFVSDIKKQ